MIQESIVHDLKRHGFELISVTEPDLCGDDPSRKLMRQLMGAFHDYEKTMIVIKHVGHDSALKSSVATVKAASPMDSIPVKPTP